MKLKPIRSLPFVKVGGRVPGELYADLNVYAAYYRDVVGESVALWPLVVQILRTFMNDDRAFRAWRREQPSNVTAPSHKVPRDAYGREGAA